MGAVRARVEQAADPVGVGPQEDALVEQRYPVARRQPVLKTGGKQAFDQRDVVGDRRLSVRRVRQRDARGPAAGFDPDPLVGRDLEEGQEIASRQQAVGKDGWFGLSGKCWVSKVMPSVWR